ncbi:MAG TPA: GxxExxY protein [Bacteroidales bacterium]|nr:GxxExxY protein [Bacteroidales bacterium]
MKEIIYKDESFSIVGAAMEVHKTLGNGFLEAVYHEALMIEFEKRGIPYKHEEPLFIKYKEVQLKKSYVADFVCYEKIIVELKALSQLVSDHESVVLNYLKASGFKLGMLINFGASSLEHKRLVK